eukprot:gene11257-21446_t
MFQFWFLRTQTLTESCCSRPNSSSQFRELPFITFAPGLVFMQQNCFHVSLRKTTKAELTKAHNDYVLGLIDIKESKDETVQKKSYSVSKKFWSYTRSKRKDVLGVEVLRKEGKDITNALENTRSTPSIGDHQLPTISNLEIESQGIAKLLSNLDPKKANGPDQIPTRVLKEAATELARILRFIFIKSLETGIVPKAWRNKNVVPVYKRKGSKQEAANYRPVSLTSVCCKTLEHIIFTNIMSHSDSQGIIVDKQYGFCSRRSCETQLITTLEDIARKRNKGSNVGILILDFSKAFDTVTHSQLIISKLDHHGIRESTDIGRWISAWLWDRKQQVVGDGETLSSVKVESGVPQGTVLGPLLFLLFMNNITMQIDSHLKVFADDCLLYEEVNDSVMAENLQRNLDLLGQWFYAGQPWRHVGNILGLVMFFLIVNNWIDM